MDPPIPQDDSTPDLVRIFPDQPVTGPDGLDFQFDGLARTLAELAWNPANATPFTAVVRGGWGRGKTTLLRQTERLLAETENGASRREVRPIWFNAWKYPSDDTVLAGLLGALLDEFRRGDRLDQLKFHVDSHKTRLARTVLNAAAPWAFGKPGDAKAWSGRYQPVEEKRAFNDLFRELFVQASHLLFHPAAALRDTGGRWPEDLWDAEMCKAHTLAIFLDDLDRCRESRVLEVLEAINLFLDLPGVCFYLGLDMERLEALLPEQLAGHKAEFLEKIVQISLDLPDISQRGASDYVRTLVEQTPLRALLLGNTDAACDDITVIAQVLGSRHPRRFTTSRATFGSGAVIGMAPIPSRRNRIPCWMAPLRPARAGSGAAAPGATARGTVVPRTATGSSPATATSTSASVVPEFRNREPSGEIAERANLARPGPRSGEGRAASGSARAACPAESTDPMRLSMNFNVAKPKKGILYGKVRRQQRSQ